MLVSVDHPNVAVSLDALADVYQATGRADEAKAARSRAVQIRGIER
jgi:cytochrome c-type biogenesis protein CcmH/NrfG